MILVKITVPFMMETLIPMMRTGWANGGHGGGVWPLGRRPHPTKFLIAVAFNHPRLLHLSRMRPTAQCSAGSRNGIFPPLHCQFKGNPNSLCRHCYCKKSIENGFECLLAGLECESLLDLNFGLPPLLLRACAAPACCQRKTHRIARNTRDDHDAVYLWKIHFEKYILENTLWKIHLEKILFDNTL